MLWNALNTSTPRPRYNIRTHIIFIRVVNYLVYDKVASVDLSNIIKDRGIRREIVLKTMSTREQVPLYSTTCPSRHHNVYERRGDLGRILLTNGPGFH